MDYIVIYIYLKSEPLKEEYLLNGSLEKTNESYAIAKIAGIKLCNALRNQYGFDVISLMPTNLYGKGDNYHSRNSHVLPSMINRFYEAKIKGTKEVMCWGTGSPKREFLFVDDLADASIFVLEKVSKKNKHLYDNENNFNGIINVGSGTTATFANLTAGSGFTNGSDTVTINGTTGNENITGPNLVTTIDGGDGADTLVGGSDNDVYRFDTNDVDAGESIADTGGSADVVAIVTTTDFSNMTAASFDDELSKNLHGVVLFAPAYVGTIRNNSMWFYAMSFLDEINLDCNDYINDQKKYDCTKYSTNVFKTSDGVEGGRIMSAVAEKDFSENKIPALSFFDYDDDVLNSYETEKRLDRWGNKKSKIVIVDSGEKDVTQHFIVGFLNPELDDFYIREINNWINNL